MDQQKAEAPGLATKLAGDRTSMATYRTHLSLERTTLAWIRTTLAMASFGFGMVAFFRTLRQTNQSAETIRLHEAAIHFGMALIIGGIVAMVLSGLSQWFTLRRLRRHEIPVISPWPLSITVGMLLAVAGLWGLWTLLGR